ncbi:MAG: NAD-dependent epimerase/dehydratase family protein [Solirubrobacterales bacterium]
MGLTVAVTGPTGEVGRPLLVALEREDAVETVRGMARRAFDPAAHGFSKVHHQRGDVLDREAVARLVEGADVVVHLAFAIFGSREETRRVNLEGTRNVFEAARDAGASRLVYTSSVAAYGFHTDNPQPLGEEVPARGSEDFYYSAQKAELEGMLARTLEGSGTEAHVFRPCIVAGRHAIKLVEHAVAQVGVGYRLPLVREAMRSLSILRPVLPEWGVRFQLVHHDDVASALAAATAGRGRPGAYNLAGDGEITLADLARALEWHSVRVPASAVGALASAAARLPLRPIEVEWVNAFRVPVIVDTSKARSELGWIPLYDALETLLETVEGGRAEGLLG